MKKTCAIILIGIFGMLSWSSPAKCQKIEVLANMSYKAIMNGIIRSYANKAAMFGPVSWKSRQEAAIAYQKAVYCRNYEEKLTREMAERNIEKSPIRVHSYLEKRFFETFHPNHSSLAKL